MTLKKFALIGTASALALAARHADAQAQAAPAAAAADPSAVAEIVVTAERRQESINSVPASIAAASGDQLRNAGVTSVADLEKLVPGFHFSEGTYSAPVYSIRGVGFNESSLGAKPDVSLSLDEIPLPFPIMAGGVTLDLARVEVLKGPQGTLYGQNATGGAVNYISAKPTDTFQAGADLTFGRFNTIDGDGFVSGPLSDTLSARLAVGTEQATGWQKSYTRDATLGRQDKSEGRLLLDWKPTSRFKAELSLNGFIDKSDTQAAQFVALTTLSANNLYAPALGTYPVAPANDQAADWDAGVPLRKNSPFYQAALRADYSVTDDITLTSISSYARYTEDRWQDPDGTSYQNILYHTAGDIRVSAQELRLSAAMGRLHWVFGGNYEYDKVSQRDNGFVGYDNNAYALAVFGGPFFSYYNLSRQTFETAAVFASADYAVTDQITAHGGIRYTSASIDYNGCTGDGGDGVLSTDFANFASYLRSFAGLPPVATPANGACVTLGAAYVPGLVTSKLDQDNTSWRAGLDWKPHPGLMAYVNVSKGYKSGSYPILSASVDTQDVPVKQESVLAYEVGVKSKLFQDTLQLNGAAFYYDYANKQLRGRVVVPVFNALETLVNVPTSDIVGGEADAVWTPVRGLTATLGATYIDSRIGGGFTNYNPFGVQQDFNGEAFPLTPKWQGSADVQYERPVTQTLIGFIGGDLSYQSATNGGLGEQALLRIAPYTLLDLRLGVHSTDNAWRFWIWGRNISNQYYWTNADHIADTTVRFAGMPATYGMTLSYRYR